MKRLDKQASKVKEQEFKNVDYIKNQTSNIQPWTEEEDKSLSEYVKLFELNNNGTTDWSLISAFFQNRTRHDCRQRWNYVLNPNITKGRFTENDDEKLYQSVLENGTDSWVKIANDLPGRTSK